MCAFVAAQFAQAVGGEVADALGVVGAFVHLLEDLGAIAGIPEIGIGHAAAALDVDDQQHELCCVGESTFHEGAAGEQQGLDEALSVAVRLPHEAVDLGAMIPVFGVNAFAQRCTDEASDGDRVLEHGSSVVGDAERAELCLI